MNEGICGSVLLQKPQRRKRTSLFSSGIKTSRVRAKQQERKLQNDFIATAFISSETFGRTFSPHLDIKATFV